MSYNGCLDPALLFNCDDWQAKSQGTTDYKGTVVIIDDGLSVNHWMNLENGYYGITVDIVKYLVPTSNGDVGSIDLSVVIHLIYMLMIGIKHFNMILKLTAMQ